MSLRASFRFPAPSRCRRRRRRNPFANRTRSPRRVQPNAIRAWRAWRVGVFEPASGAPAEVFLRSCVHDAYWTPRDPVSARCVEHVRPSLSCGCGIYAVTTREAALEWAQTTARAVPMPFVIGEVHLWGRVLRYSSGYRAQYAYPYSLEVLDQDLPRELDPKLVVRQLRDAYIVDVTHLRLADTGLAA